MKRLASAAILMIAAAAIFAGSAVADPTRNIERIDVSCENGFTGTLIGIPFTPTSQALLVSNGTSAFVVNSANIYNPDGSFLFNYQKPGDKTGQSFTSCTFVVEQLGYFGTLTGFFTPIGQ